VKYPISVPAEGFALRRPRATFSLALTDAWRFALRHWGLLAALAVTFAVHAPTLRYFFDGDDFVVLGDIQYRGNAHYLLDTFLMRDIVPNWRPLTGLVYMVEWRLFGLDAAGWRAVNLAVHLGSLGLMYALVLRATRRPAAGAVAALIFGVAGAHFDTVTYITALPHVLATFFVLASLLAIVAYAQGNERHGRLFALSFGCFALAFLANEGAFVFAPVIVAAYALFARRWLDAPVRIIAHAFPFGALAAGWLAFYESCSCPQLKFDGYSFGPHVASNYAVYLSYIPAPVRNVPGDPTPAGWAIAGVVLAVMLFLFVRGPNIARVCVLGVALALLPYVPVEIWTASRYTYAAVAFFAIGGAVAGYQAFDRVRGAHRWLRVPAQAVALALVVVVTGLYAWQSYAQDARSGRGTDRWQLLADQLRANYREVPPGTTIWIIDGPWTNPMEQYTWVPSVARALYGDAAAFDLPAGAYQADPPDTQRALFLRWTIDGLRPVPEQQVVAPQ